MTLFNKTAVAMSVMLAVSSVQAATPSNEEIWKLLQQVQQQLTQVQQQNNQLKVENQTLKVQVEKTEQTAIEANETAEALVEATEQAVKSASVSSTTIGGYGELHYNNLEDKNGQETESIDFHRFVLFFGHEFNDRLRLFSELELEHSISGDGKVGEIELEQAYLEYDINQQHRVKGGLFLMPVGIINETHEPATFYGTERNPVEKNIVPATWWEGGVMFSGEIANGFSYDLAVTSGLSAKDTNYKIRDGRQKVGKANAESLAYTGRLKWTAIPGIELAATAQYQEDFGQENNNKFIGDAGSATLFETHAVIERGNFGLRALYATWDLDGSGPESNGADEQTGWYVEPSYRINQYFGLFTRYSEWDNQAGNSSDSEYEQFDLGVNWWPHRDVVVKFDYQNQDVPADKTEQDGFNLGLGYQF